MWLLHLLFPNKFHQHIKRKILLIFALGILLRFVLMAFSIHPDFFFIHMFPNLIISHQVFEIYNLFEKELAHLSGFYYTPTVLWTFTSIQFILTPLISDLGIYMNKAFQIYKIGNSSPVDYIFNIQVNYFKIFFVLKAPYLIFDLGILYILLKQINQWGNAKKVFYLWTFNPVILYGTYIYGQFDIIGAFLLLLGIYLAIQKKVFLGILIIGVAATFKNFSLLAILPLALIYGKSIKQKLLISFIGFLPFFLSSAYIYLESSSQVLYSLIPKFYLEKVALDQTAYAIFSKLARLISFSMIYLGVLAVSLFKNISAKEKSLNLILISLISFFALNPIILFHYLIIVTPLLLIALKGKKYIVSLFLIYLLSAATFKLWAREQQLGVFAPINKSFYTDLYSTSELIGKYFPYSWISSPAYIIFFLSSIFVVLILLKKMIFQSQNN